MSTVAQQLTDLVRVALERVGHAVPAGEALEPCLPTQDRAHGDWQSNAAFRVAKAARTNPRALAESVRAELAGLADGRFTVEVAGPGFLNFRLADAWLAEDVASRAADPRFGAPSPGKGRTVVIDYSSPNVAKRMHVGHLRSTNLGNALDRLYRFLGWTVIADNHVGDWGTPFGMLIVAWNDGRDEAAYAADPIAELLRLYQGFRDRAKDDPALLERARDATARLQAGDPEHRALWTRFVDASMREYQAIYDRLDVRFDVVLGESFYEPMLRPLVDSLLDRGLARVDDGAVIVPFDDDPKLADKPLLVRKRDGAALYGTTDLATIQYRVERWQPERIVYVTDVRQQDHFRQVFAAAAKMGFHLELVHVWFGMLKLPGGEVAASRVAGAAISLVDVLDEAARRARSIVDEHADDIPDEAERAAIAETVGTGALRYADLSQNPQSDVTFEWDKMLALQGNSAPYLLYAHARCRSILAKGAVRDVLPTLGADALADPEARELAVRLAQLPESILAAATHHRPNLLAEALYGIAATFSRFYLACPVLKPDVPPSLRAGRLALVGATARALRLGLGLLGLAAPERM